MFQRPLATYKSRREPRRTGGSNLFATGRKPDRSTSQAALRRFSGRGPATKTTTSSTPLTYPTPTCCQLARVSRCTCCELRIISDRLVREDGWGGWGDAPPPRVRPRVRMHARGCMQARTRQWGSKKLPIAPVRDCE